MRRVLRKSLWVAPAVLVLMASHTPDPTAVTLVGDLQSEQGCTGGVLGDWDPACAATHLTYSAEFQKWTGSFSVGAGSWQYKVALNDAWTESYGAPGTTGDGNLSLSLAAAGTVKFYYDHQTHWVGNSAGDTIATVAGSFQSELGCTARLSGAGGDWEPPCLATQLTDRDRNGQYVFTTTAIPAGNYEFKVAHNETWAESYGEAGGNNNMRINVLQASQPVTFRYVPASHQTFVSGAIRPGVGPTSVTIAGTFQSELGCTGGAGGDWDPPCPQTFLTYDGEDDLWVGSFNVPQGAQEYKAALNGTWDVSYGKNGNNIAFSNPAAGMVKFYYDEKAHAAVDKYSSMVASAAGSFQTEIGCPNDWDPACLRAFLTDPDGDNVYDAVTPPLPAGTYEMKVVIDESWGENYGASCMGGVGQNPGNITFTVPAGNPQPVYFAHNRTSRCTVINIGGRPRGDLGLAKAHWLEPDLIAVDLGGPPPMGATAKLHHDPAAGLTISVNGLAGGTAIDLTFDPNPMPAPLVARYKHLKDLQLFRVAGGAPANLQDILKDQIAVGVWNSAGQPIDGTSVQTYGVLDAVYGEAARAVALGATWSAGVPTIRVWAPTAQTVRLLLYDDATTATSTATAMTLDPATGVWSATGQAGWAGKYYVFEVRVFTRATRAVETNLVTDPYSVDLSMNSRRTRLTDLSDPASKPAGWDSLAKPALDQPEDIVLYELHIRDFSATDQTVTQANRGKYKAFTESTSNGMKHLQRLANAGLTHVHLLPAFDIASVNEDPAQRMEPNVPVGGAPDSQAQQTAVAAVRDRDAFNWGYDPLHYGAPEGSYATDPNDGKRVVEFREMVKALSDSKLRVVMDVVYNHTNASGQNANSVLDRIVPGYYHRYSVAGRLEMSTCCDNTATENTMMEKLMVDTLVTWARQYKVDGFRFDIMGHHTKANILAARDALRALTPAADGVDGSKIYLYGEGWNFGEVENDQRFLQARQANMGGTGIGTFNDRIRDAVRGGGPFSGLQEQGFATGLFTLDNGGGTSGGTATQRGRLAHYADLIRTSMAGNLKLFPLRDSTGREITGADLDYGGQKAAYTEDPSEIINYVSAHDNETLFDAIQLKAPKTLDMKTRVRMNTLALATVLLGQGVPFFHAGDEILRSKSLDRNSYNSGDWFNKLDWTYETNNWGVGLPPQQDNGRNWPVMGPLLADPQLKPTKADIEAALSGFEELLRIRKSSPLFRMRTAQDVIGRVKYWNTGANQVPGLLVMELKVAEGQDSVDDVMVIINATPDTRSFIDSSFATRMFVLHPVQTGSVDMTVQDARFVRQTGQFTVPAWTAAVFQAIPSDGVVTDQLNARCGCATSPDMALGGAVLALVLWLRRRTNKKKAMAAAALGAALLGCGSQEAPYTAVQFQVTNGTTFRPAGYGMSIVGSHPALGDNEAAKGLKLRLQPDGTFRGAAWLPIGTAIQYHAQMTSPSAAELDAMDAAVERTVTPSDPTPAQVVDVVKWSAPTDVVRPCINFVVSVPPNTPSGDDVYIAGGDDQLGPWNPGKTKLTKQSDGTYRIQLCFDQGKLLEYKYTRGDWGRVEKAEDGSELANRTLLVSENQTKPDTVVKWADL